MFGLFKKDPAKNLRKQYDLLLEEARDIQRSGDLKAYARKLEEAESIWAEIEKIKQG
ncbi:MAG: Lacal_2735 family protein [Saprospiraceae bacterium]|nr:Lacal_2735 family protein [Saprospiraceae bacterium]